jgi:integrase
MAVFKKRNRWFIDYYLPGGQRKREVVTIEGVDPSNITRQDAINALSIRKAEQAQGKFNIVKTEKKIPFTDLVTKFLEYSKTNKKSYTRDITSSRVLIDYFGSKTVQQINSWHIEQYKSKRQKDITRFGKPPAKATINRELAFLKTMFSKAVKWKITNINPVKDIKLFKENNANLRILSNEEFYKLYESANDFLKPILLVAINTGMRRSEIFNLKWQDINYEQEYICVIDSKNNESRIIPMNPVLKDTINNLHKIPDSEYVFSQSDGMPIKSIKTFFWSALKSSGINHCRFHDLRHSFASRLVMAGVDIVTVQELMGHKSIIMTRRYSHPTPEHKKQAVNRLNLDNIDTYLDTRYNKQEKEAVISTLNY